ncbi:50S ribosomal protein L4 [Pontibacter sp. BT310]|jgi:large subunit ribosomal protein L4|uniref:Large ribosomal subunit protein uL4 n=1 Tax=Pontibacter populi TaxID=890055 RepID=A0ABS6X7W0_9BACT|nr:MULTISPECIES: 50S ribosomal protein L4 [Pontibacter]MBJ6117226.1 50S ribosomal protein L4 [Pontibacter sp. BT310]MBR0569651.1 50S ribosomal protein L4 [Microvirga sp. STS03]MBW3364079.1 50S ribosomal protein L4 [Pontibacter populi]
MELSVLNIKGEDTGRKIALSDAVFGAEPNQHAMYLDVKQYLANQRQGTHKSKERNEVAGSTKKIKKQKGTGGARAGSIKSPVFVGGGRVFGPKPRNYSFKLNKKLKTVARVSALSLLAKDNKVALVESFSLETPKTKDFIAILNNIKSTGKTLFVIPAANDNIVLSGRNIPKVKVATATDLNTYDLLNAERVVLVEESVNIIENLLSNK